MTSDAALFRAYAARDRRFDGVFYVGVTSTGIYCRPVCTARTPKPAHCRFFRSAAEAERERFRPCLRCRPELAPGNAPVDDAHRVASLIAYRIDEGMLDDGAGLERIAEQFGWSSRQIRRVVRKEMGVSPIELVLTRRLLLAKQLLTETDLPITEVAFASGFASLRRFNDAFSGRYGMPPTRFRKAAERGMASVDGAFTLQLSYRPPFDWSALLGFLRRRALAGVESVGEDSYARAVRLGTQTGWICVRDLPGRRVLTVEISHSLMPVVPPLLGRLRNLFDLSARPDLIAERLGQDPLLESAVALRPGLRVPGAFDGFELAVRAILGQQISVKAATTLAARFVERFGAPAGTPQPGVTRLTPDAAQVARASIDQVAGLGIIESRARGIVALAGELASGRLRLEPGADPAVTMDRLTQLPGIGSWTAQYIAMRALRWPDAFPREDVVVRAALGGVTGRRAEAMSQAWRPWRSYATMHLWQLASAGPV
jgi:AraC family transcriptional regulator of adaptative response / DNA-3-methyladenine glycosylase II